MLVGLISLQMPSIAIGQSYTRTEVTTYHDNTNAWILGQVTKTTCIAPVECTPSWAPIGIVIAETTFDPTYALPTAVRSFGKLQQTRTYDTTSSLASGQLGTLRTVADGNNNLTTYTNWKRGVPQNIQYPITADSPGGATQSAMVDNNGWIVAFTDENGYKTCYAYDAMGRTVQITYPSESTVGACDASAWNVETSLFVPVAHDEHGLAAGHWTRMRRLGNRHVNTYYDALWRPVLEESLDYADIGGTLSQVVKRYDHDSRVIFQSYPKRGVDRLTESQGVHTVYDALGRVTGVSQDSEHGLLTTLTEYLPGFKTRVTNPRGQPSLTIYQVFDQPTYDAPAGTDHPEGASTEIHRDVFGKVTALRRRNADASVQAWRYYGYNIHQELCRSEEPETGTTLMGYDGAGNLKWSSSGLPAGQVCEPNGTTPAVAARRSDRTYDSRNRLQDLAFPAGIGSQTWQYWPDGLPRKVTTHNDGLNAGVVENDYVYNKRRLLTGESSTQLGWYTWALGYGYDGNGSLSTQTYPTGLVISYVPNALGQATQARDQSGYYYASAVGYYPNGATKQFTYGNGIVHSMSQNARQLPLVTADSGGTHRLQYSYDSNGNVDNIYDLDTPSKNRYLFYDGLDRLTAAGSAMFGGSDHYHRFTYNALDNITSWKHAGVKDYAEYVYSQNRLTNIKNSGGASVVGLEYDPQGNLAVKNNQTYQFDYGNRLRVVSGKEHYRYDGRGRRVLAWDVASTNSILSMYSNAGQLLYQEDYKNGKNQENIYLAGSIIAIRESPHAGGIFAKFQHTDALGSPVAVTNQAGAVIERNDYEPYGAMIGKPSYQGIGYTGHFQDGATGLTYMQQRYYDPTVGLFLSVDPVTAYSNPVGMFNRYRYAANNPYRFLDPDGRFGRDALNGLLSEIRGAVIRYAGSRLSDAADGAARAAGEGVRRHFETHTYSANVGVSGTLAAPMVPGAQNLVPKGAIGGSLTLSVTHRGQVALTGSFVPMWSHGGGQSLGGTYGIGVAEGGSRPSGLEITGNHHAELTIPVRGATIGGAVDWDKQGGSISGASQRLGIGTLSMFGVGEQVNFTYRFNEPEAEHPKDKK
ncbi:RHS repeat-associated core domain-containing protein [Pseudoxanthomonas sp. YR558]|nr:RHS repeat-associated core domain-containing protein [Pseudoxanthomonas sp. YR558]